MKDITEKITQVNLGLPVNYFEDGKRHLKERLESNEDMFNNWIGSNYRYVLVSKVMIIGDNLDGEIGPVNGRFDYRVYSDSVEHLKMLWNTIYIKRHYDSTVQHFIADAEENKVIEFLSVCM